MPHVCPRPCSRLATAAVFISVGVVQFVVGIILLRSKYVYLLAGPDFWTAFINIIVGCLLGVTASVWKQPKKRKSKKHIIRRNFVLALLFSGMLINITTLGMLILGEANTLMSIRLESNGRYTNQTFVGEILAYAYATSVCSPIVCIVVAIVAIAGNCFNMASRKNSIDLKTDLSSLKKDRPQSLQWVYTPEVLGLTKKNSEIFLTSSSESDDETSDDVPTYKRNANSAEELQNVFHRMAQGKRESILSDGAIMLRQLELRRKNNKHHSLIQDSSYGGPTLSQAERSASSDKKSIRDDLIDYDILFARSGKFSRDLSDRNTRLSSTDIALKPLTHLKSKQCNIPYIYDSDEELGEYQNTSSQLAAKNFSSLKRDFNQKLQTRSETDILHCRSDNDKNSPRPLVVVYKKSEGKPKLKADLTTDQPRLKGKYELSRHHSGENIPRIEFSNSEAFNGVLSPELGDCFSPDGSEFGGDSLDLPRRSSWAGEIIPINVNKSPFARLSHKLIPTPSPVVPKNQMINVTATVESNCTDNQNQNTPEKKANISSFRESMNISNKENPLEYPMVGSLSIKKHDFAKLSVMASISEEPNSEMHQSIEGTGSYYVPQETGATPKAPKGNLRKKSLISAYSESSKETSQDDGQCPQNDKALNRKRNASCTTLRRLWSSVGSEKDVDYLEQVVDEDSLIGLSEEELIARQFRNRSIRKALQQRIRNEIII